MIEEEPDINQHELLVESTNLDSLEEMLVANSITNILDIPQEEAALINLLSKGFVQVEILWKRLKLSLEESYKPEFLNLVT